MGCLRRETKAKKSHQGLGHGRIPRRRGEGRGNSLAMEICPQAHGKAGAGEAEVRGEGRVGMSRTDRGLREAA